MQTSKANTAAMQAVPERAAAVLSYWFGPDYLKPNAPGEWQGNDKLWWGGDPAVDQDIKARFAEDVEAFGAGKYDDWLDNPYTGLAGVILGDQFSRNIHRGTPQAFALDPKAISWARHLQDSGMARQLAPVLRSFLNTPFMHSEQLEDQQRCVDSIRAEYEAEKAVNAESDAAKAWAFTLKFAEAHRDVIVQWGRFPHRNKILGRQSTPEEEAGLADGSIGRW
eukprot:GHRR01005059.1.p1 GENE.GHRR01005059.1~~GHRR01005059.1.p1  ORF type:complete len:223 (+),score=61.62 GHRR01005059.1:97-765(+)